jgi:acetylornithine deacetylase/succinyl-diaminopimelate desuccinylase-like protein
VTHYGFGASFQRSDAQSCRIKLPELWCAIPPDRTKEAGHTATLLGASVYKNFPWVDGAHPHGDEHNHAELLLRRTWHPALSVTGAAGFPSLEQAGNVLRTFTAFKLSMRLPPRCDSALAGPALKRALEANPPCGAHVEFQLEKAASGWDAPAQAPWLTTAIDSASRAFYSQPPAYFGEGGSIPFMGMLGELFPQAQFVVTGVLGPGSNAHGPNEFLHIDFTKKIICCVTHILAGVPVLQGAWCCCARLCQCICTAWPRLTIVLSARNAAACRSR